jgi:hypothetical protein
VIVVLDPALFLASQGGLAWDEDALRRSLDDVLRICQTLAPSACIPDYYPYWGRLQRELVSPLRLTCRNPRTKRAIDQLSHCTGTIQFPPAPTSVTTDLHQLYDWAPLAPSWLEVMNRVVLGCSLADDTILVVRLSEGRNLTKHVATVGTGSCELLEKRVWAVTLTAPNRQLRVPCVCNQRNVNIPWTARFDDQLPAHEDGARYPFYPPSSWENSGTAWRVRESRPCWLDSQGNAWARPATPAPSYHWDVFLAKAQRDRIGVNEINVVRYGALPANGAPGFLHHIPKDKASHVSDRGWRS